MKKTNLLIIFIVIALASAAFATLVRPFSNWDTLIKQSTNIIIARCKETPERLRVSSNGATIETSGGVIRSEMQILSELKGKINLTNLLIDSAYWPRQREAYLIFGIYHDGFIQANEEYCFIPLGPEFSTNMLAGKSFDQQIKELLTYRLNTLNFRMKEEQEEKQRLEQALIK
jgi:hypothetical protein